MTSIEWTDTTWNPIVGCSRVSAGCENCYAERFVHRGMSPQHRGLTVLRNHGPGWTGEVRLVAGALAKPLGWKKPRRVFVNSLSDLFHEKLSNEAIAAVFGVMAAAHQHTFQVLTKRPERARAWFDWAFGFGELRSDALRRCRQQARYHGVDLGLLPTDVHANGVDWPLPNVWLGVTAEDQAAADERVPLLLDTPAAIRFVSYEPALGPADFSRWLGWEWKCPGGHEPASWSSQPGDGPRVARCDDCGEIADNAHGIDWLIVGGESGPAARRFATSWARSAIAQCKAAGVPVFMKQLGRVPFWDDWSPPPQWSERPRPLDLKGKTMSEWPEDLRVREFPEARR